MLALFCALKQESGEIRKEMSISRVSSVQNFSVIEGKCRGKESLLVLTGVGRKNAVNAGRFVLEKYPVSVVISTGFGGSLNEKTGVGDIVICSRLLNGECSPIDNKPLVSDLQLVSTSEKLLENSGLAFIAGTGVTVPFLSSTPENKKSLGNRYEADMVEMESYWIAELADERSLPFLEVRSISDSVKDDLSILDRLISASGRIKPVSAATLVLSHPENISTMKHLAENAKRAEKNLAVFITRLVKEI